MNSSGLLPGGDTSRSSWLSELLLALLCCFLYLPRALETANSLDPELLGLLLSWTDNWPSVEDEPLLLLLLLPDWADAKMSGFGLMLWSDLML